MTAEFINGAIFGIALYTLVSILVTTIVAEIQERKKSNENFNRIKKHYEQESEIIKNPEELIYEENVRRLDHVNRTLYHMLGFGMSDDFDSYLVDEWIEDESNLLTTENIGKVFYGEEELANGMSKFIVEQYIPQ